MNGCPAGVKIAATRRFGYTWADGSTSLLRAADALTAEEVLPGFSCPVADLFRFAGGRGGRQSNYRFRRYSAKRLLKRAAPAGNK